MKRPIIKDHDVVMADMWKIVNDAIQDWDDDKGRNNKHRVVLHGSEPDK